VFIHHYFFFAPDLFAADFLGADLFEDDFLEPDFFDADFFDADFFFGTLAPSLRASERPIAIACFRLVTFLPLRPLFSCPCFFSCMAFLTLFCDFFEYLAIV